MTSIHDEVLLTSKHVEKWKTERVALFERLKKLDSMLALIDEIATEKASSGTSFPQQLPESSMPKLLDNLEATFAKSFLVADERTPSHETSSTPMKTQDFMTSNLR